jgi:monofunctional biosynthetic peptidoglycan transglycosylase
MHNQSKPDDHEEGPEPAAADGYPAWPAVTTASAAVVSRIAGRADSEVVQGAPLGRNRARPAHLAEVARARCPVPHARVSAAAWPALHVRVTPADWRAPTQASVPGPGPKLGRLERPDQAPLPPPAEMEQQSPGTPGSAIRAGDILSVRPVQRLSLPPEGPASQGEEQPTGGRLSPFESAAPIDRVTALYEPTRTEDDPVAVGAPRRTLGSYVRTGLRWGAIAFAAWFAAMLALIVVFRFVDPPGSTLIAWQALTGAKVERRWVPLSKISKNLQRAVIVSEDGRFCQHWGVDPREVVAAIRRARGGIPRGASTITMQVAKNLFLWSSKSYLRKALELPLAMTIELVWPKSRILEVYLNIAEWGPGVFGAEAAARHHFKKSVSRLSRREAALLAVALPNPLVRVAGKPGPGTSRLARTIVVRMRLARGATACVAQSR